MPGEYEKRYNKPSKYDVAPRGTIYEVVMDSDSSELIVQLSDNHNVSDWQPIGTLLTGAFKSYLHDETFILLCLYLYGGHADGYKHLPELADLIDKGRNKS